jgi:hypothetical protein
MKKKVRKGNKQANKQHPKKEEEVILSTFLYIL